LRLAVVLHADVLSRQAPMLSKVHLGATPGGRQKACPHLSSAAKEKELDRAFIVGS